MDDLLPYEHQVAGWHNGALSSVLKNQKGQILKPVKLNANPTYTSPTAGSEKDGAKDSKKEELSPVCQDERAFYELVSSSTKEDDETLREIIPKYYGCQEITKADGKVIPHLVLEDLAHGLVLPCVMDVKIGLSQNYPNKTKANAETKYVTQSTLGFCLTGVRVYHPSQGKLIMDMRPDSCKRLKTAAEVFDALEVFRQQKSSASKLISESVVESLLNVRRWVSRQRSYKIRRGSVLVIYDASSLLDSLKSGTSNVNDDDKPMKCSKTFSVTVKMIDFAHVFHANGQQDDNYLIGLDNLINFFSRKE